MIKPYKEEPIEVADHLRPIEVKGRMECADVTMITRPEGITSLHESEGFIQAGVRVEKGFARMPRYVRGTLDTRDPTFGHNAIQLNVNSLLERAEAPGESK